MRCSPGRRSGRVDPYDQPLHPARGVLPSEDRQRVADTRGGGAEVKAYSSAAQAIILLGVVPLYGWIATHLNRNRLLRWTTLFFASNLLIFYFVGQAGARIGVVYYIWVGIFNVFTVAQLWAFATDLFSLEQGKRLFPLLGAGASAGAVAGAWIAGTTDQTTRPLQDHAHRCRCVVHLRCSDAAGGLHHHEARRSAREEERPGDA